MKKLLAIAALLSVILYFPGCTKSTKEEGSDAAQAESGGLEIPDANASGNPDETQAGFLDDQLPEDALGSVPPSDQAENQPPPLDLGAPTDENPPALDLSAPTGAETNSVIAAEPPKAEGPPKAEEPSPKPVATLQKVKDAPYREGDQLVNAVYIARPGDDYKKISTMIYGNTDEVKSLKKANPGMKSVKPGNKVYYSSPKRPDDESRIVNYYEETGMPPEVYIAKEGENLKTIANDLLGYKEAWKEVWATNPVESKNKLSAGTELRFWRGAASTANLAINTPPPPNIGVDGGIAPPPTQDMPPPPPMNEAKAPDMPPPPPPTQDMPPPPPAEAKMPDLPPPPPPEMAPPPFAPAPVAKKQKQANQDDALDQDTIMALGGAGIVAAALAALIVIRKRKQRAAEFGNQTHV